MHKAFPEIIDTDYTLNAIDYVLGRHPANNLFAGLDGGHRVQADRYGHNRADYGFIPGGLVPGVLIVKPELPS